MQSFIADLTRLPLWLLLFGLTVIGVIGFYWLGQLGKRIRLPKPSDRAITLLSWFALSALLSWCATTFIQSGLFERHGGQAGWNESHRLLFVAITLYLTPFLSRYFKKG